jgi:peptidyl-prolyl cis-trans isomerase D
MLQQIRDHSGKWFVKIIFGLIVASFMIFGIGDLVRGVINHKPVAKVGDQNIYMEQYAQEIQRETSRIQSMSKGKISSDQLKQMGFYTNLLDKMIERQAINLEFARLNLLVSNATIKNNVKSLKEFQNNGQFDYSKYEEMLKQAGISERMLVQDMRQQFINQQYFGSLTGATYLPKFYKDLLLQSMEQKRTFAIISIDADKINVTAQPSKDDLKTFYETNKDIFKKPELRKFSVMVIDVNDLSKNEVASESDIAEEYTKRLQEFTTPEKRYVKLAVFTTEDAAKKAKDMLSQGRDLEAITKEIPESKFEDIGFVEKARLNEKSRDIIFALDVGKVSDIIHADFGFHFYQVTQAQPEKVKTASDVHAQLEQDIKRQKFAAQYEKLKNKIDDELAGGAKLQEVSKQYALSVYEFDNIDKSATNLTMKTELNDHKQQIIEQAFSLNENIAGQVTDINDHISLVIYVDKITPEHIPDMADIEKEITAKFVEDAKYRKAYEVAQNIANQSSDMKVFAQEATNKQLPLQSNIVLSRSTLGENQLVKESGTANLFERAFMLPVGKAMFGRSKNGFIVVMLEHVQPFKVEDIDKAKRDAFEKNIKQITQRDIAESLVESFKQFHQVKKNDDNINYILKTIGSQN